MAKISGFNRLMAKVFFKLARLREKQGQPGIALQFADSALQINLKRNDFEPVIETAKFLSVLNTQIDNTLLAAKYLKLSNAYSDSLRNRETSVQFLNDKAYLAGANTKLAIKDLRYRQVISSKTIGQQKIMIFVTLLITLIFILVFILITWYRKRLNDAHLILARRTLEVVAKDVPLDDFPLLPEPNEANDDLISQLDKLIQSEKIYLDPNLSLVNLA